MSEANIAVVGCGYWGKNLVRNFASLGALRSVVDCSPLNLKQAKANYPEVNTFADIKDVINDPLVKGVVIATPAVTHFAMASQVLASGKDVFVEKPLALTVDEGKQLVELASAKSAILMVGHLLRYHPAIVKLQELLKTGELGKLQYIYSNRLNLGKFRTEENILWSFAPHDIDVMLSLAGETPQSVSCHGGNYLNHDIADVTVTNLSFPSDIRGHIFVSWLHPYKEQRLVAVGSKGMAVFDDLATDHKLTIYREHIDWSTGIPVPQKNGGQVVEIESIEPLKSECQHFLDCISTRQQPLTDGHNGLATLKILAAAQSSLENEGKIVRFD
ncbi:oxidoreductase [Dehalogenimonas sp. WBC-2]|nr:oxidoreductase [Dehalogenimonas sp. WBC-2]